MTEQQRTKRRKLPNGNNYRPATTSPLLHSTTSPLLERTCSWVLPDHPGFQISRQPLLLREVYAASSLVYCRSTELRSAPYLILSLLLVLYSPLRDHINFRDILYSYRLLGTTVLLRVICLYLVSTSYLFSLQNESPYNEWPPEEGWDPPLP